MGAERARDAEAKRLEELAAHAGEQGERLQRRACRGGPQADGCCWLAAPGCAARSHAAAPC
jgi:hypothetical protein